MTMFVWIVQIVIVMLGLNRSCYFAKSKLFEFYCFGHEAPLLIDTWVSRSELDGTLGSDLQRIEAVPPGYDVLKGEMGSSTKFQGMHELGHLQLAMSNCSEAEHWFRKALTHIEDASAGLR